jgi:MYXO-CTERM domain-containing protein
MTTTTVNLGATYASATIRLRFRIATDAAAGGVGWIIDSLAFTGLVGTPFSAVVANAGGCVLNNAPVASAGPAQAVDERTVATLDGSGSTDPDGDPITFAWTQLSGPAAVLSSANAQRPTFTVPEVTATTAAVFQLVVTDVHGLPSAPASVTITFRNVNRAPLADAGPNQAVDERTVVTLDGSSSGDPEGDAITFAWTQLSGPAAALSSATTQRPTFTAPEVTATAAAVFQLVVTDSHGLASAAATVTVTIRDVNRPPLAVAAGGSAPERLTATLEATGSSDPDGTPLTYAWTQLSGPPVNLAGASTATPSFTTPEVTADTVLVFEVTVSDGLLTATAQATFTVLNVNRPPIAVAADLAVTGVLMVMLDGSGSSDPDGDPLTFTWTQASGPAVTLTGAATATVTFQTPLVTADVSLGFDLQLSDGAATVHKAVQVLVHPVTPPAVPPAPSRAGGCGCTSTGDATPIALLGLLLAGGLRRRRKRV